MGKKVSESSLKISKKYEKKQLNGLIKVLRPKVYITDTSSFKKLVQDLTGNGSTTFTNIIVPPQPTKPEAIQKSTSVLLIEDDGVVAESSVESSSLDEIPQTYFDEMALENLSTNYQHADLLAYQDLESWLLHMMEPLPSYTNYPHIEQQVCLYNYDLSGLL